MNLPPFKLEEFWKKYEFTAPYLLCCSDAETVSMQELLAMADAESKELWETLHLGYTESPGHPLLRKEIAKLYLNVGPDSILTFAGAEEGIYCSLRVLINPGDHVIVLDPCYQSLGILAKNFGAEISVVKLNPEKNWKLDIADLKKAFRPNTKLLILNYPHNPTGTLIDKQTLQEVVSIARKSKAYIFCDEVYRYMEIDEKQRMPSIVEIYEKGITLNVMTKSFGLAGLRIGWIASQNIEFVKEVGSYKLYTSICNSAPGEILALIGLRAKEKLLQRNREIMLRNLEILDSFMERNSKLLSWVRPESGTVAIIKLLLPKPVEQFAEELVDKSGVLVMPGTIFDLEGNYFRIGFGKKNMPDILKRFEEHLNK